MVLQGFGCLKPETGPESRSELTLAGLRDFPQPLAERLRAQAAGRPGWRPGVAIPGLIRRSLRAIKSANEPVVAGPMQGLLELYTRRNSQPQPGKLEWIR